MTDVVSPAKRSQMMSGIKGKNSLPEMLVRKALFAMGYRFRLHRRDLPGTPDIAMPGRRIAIFVHGCFWHGHAGCRYFTLPKTREEFWATKIQTNVERDFLSVQRLLEAGWRVAVVWECALRDEPATALNSLQGFIRSEHPLAEIRSSR